ncbi:MAG: S8 family serine peptidase, partial [Acidimicrobiia bacterium]
AGIIAGRDGTTKIQKGTEKEFLGIAPGSRIVSVKVGNFEGAVDVSQVIAAIDWVVEHRNSDGLNIRVLNLSFGTTSTQSYLVDPLAHAVERAWKAGIVVVIAAGNDGNSALVRNPATSPFVIAVGASIPNSSYSASDDMVTSFSNCGGRGVDVVAPGKSVVSLLVPGSKVATDHPESIVAGRFLLGSGSSQAAAVVSGAAALIIDQRPDITPDQLKKLLKSTAQPIPGASSACQGSGLLDLKKARDTATPSALASKQTFAASTGAGSLDLARGNVRVSLGGVDLTGEIDIFGQPYNSATHAVLGTTWSGGQWNGTTWSGTTWSSNAWTGTTWSGTTWSGTTWSANSWTGTTWSGTTWSGTTWSGTTWSTWGWSSSGWSRQTWG